MALAKVVINQTGAIREFEKPEVCEAIKVANANRWTVALSPTEWDERKARLKKEYEKHANASDKMGMTLEEAKDILKKEFAVVGLHKSTEPFVFDESGWIEHEKPSVLEAFRVLANGGYYISISGHDYNMREKRLKKEYEENTKAPGSAENSIKGDLSGNKSIEHCGEPIPGSPLSAVEGIKLKWKDNRNTSENPALKESASQFNDALLDEQAKKIEELTEENERLKDQVAVIYECKENNEKYNLKQIKRLGKEISKLNGIIHDKNAVLADVAEELRLSKIREKNLTDVCQKYMKENEELRKKYAQKVVDKIDAQALKSAESALAYKEKVIAEKDEVIANLGKELKAKHKKFVWYKGAYDAAQQILNTIADYAAKHSDKKFSDQMVWVDKAEEGRDHSAIIARCCKNIAISKDEAEIIERCTKNGTELHYSEKDGFTYTNMFGDEMPIICLRGMCQVFTDEEIKNMKK